MNKQKSWVNPFKRKVDHPQKKKSEIDNNNNGNNNNTISTGKIAINQKTKVSVPIFNYPATFKSCFKINDKSKGVQKSKSKTPAQDRLHQIFKKDGIAVNDLLKSHMVDLKSTVKHVLTKKDDLTHGRTNALKSHGVAKCTNDVKLPPVQTATNVNSEKSTEAKKIQWSNDFVRNESVSRIGMTNTFDANTIALNPTSLFYRPENGLQTHQAELGAHPIKKGHDAVQAENCLKINGNSKIIGVKRLKSKTPAQDRLQKLVDKNKAAVFESLKKLANDDMIVYDPKSHRKSIGIQKSHITGVEPSIIDIVDKNGSMNGCNVDAAAAADDDDTVAYIVPDTNVFLNSLACIKTVIDKGSNSKGLKYSIFVPFVVLQELDSLKQRGGEQNFTKKFNAKRAIRFIYELTLTADNKRLQGQSAIADRNQLINSKSNDDKILNCCLQLVKQSKTVTLVTNDISLTNIAKINGIETITHKRCMDQFE